MNLVFPFKGFQVKILSKTLWGIWIWSSIITPEVHLGPLRGVPDIRAFKKLSGQYEGLKKLKELMQKIVKSKNAVRPQNMI